MLKGGKPHRDAGAAARERWYRRVPWRRAALLALAIALAWLGRDRVAEVPKWRAREALRDRRPESALSWLSAAERIGGADGEVEFLRARAHRRSGRFDLTRDHLLAAAKLGHPLKPLEREQWLAMAQAGQMREAEPHLPALLADPGDDAAEICEAYAIGFVRDARLETALSLLASWAADYPEDHLPLLMRGKLMIEFTQWEKAVEALKKARALRPDDFESTYYLAHVYYEQRRLDEALGLYAACVEVAPAADRDRARIGRIRCLRTLGLHDEGRRAALEILQVDSRHREALIEFARIESDAGRFAEAVEALEKADASRYPDIEVRYAWAAALRGAGRVEEARVAYERITASQAALAKTSNLIDRVTRSPADVDARFEVGRIFLEHGDPEKGVTWLQSVLNYSPAHGPTCRVLADYYRRRSADDPGFAELARFYELKTGAAYGPPQL